MHIDYLNRSVFRSAHRASPHRPALAVVCAVVVVCGVVVVGAVVVV
jgi:hypothetical protein